MATPGAGIPPVTGGLADELAARFEQSSERLTAKRHTAIDALVTGWLEAHEQDLAQMVRPHIEWHAGNGDYPDSVRDLFSILAAPEHQTQFFTALFAIQGIINAFVQAAVQPYVNDVAQAAWKHDASLALSPAEAAEAVLKGWRSEDWARAEARLSGIGDERFGVMVDIAGEPPGIMAMLDLERRGLISTDELDKAIRQSRIRPEWIPAVHLMATMAPSTSQVIAGAIENHLSESEARAKWKQAGGRDEDYEWQYQTAGRPPGPSEMLHLLNRGEISEAEFVQAVRESDIKDKYVPAIRALGRYLPPPRSIVAMVRQGAISDPDAKKLLHENGVVDADIESFIKSAHHTRTTAQKALSVSQTVRAYEDHVITRDQAAQRITAAGYPSSDATTLLDISDNAIVHHEQMALAQHAHALYTKWRLDRAGASMALDTAGVPQVQRDRLLTLWDLERKENGRLLTKAEVLGAYRRGIRDETWTNDRLRLLGYADSDLDVLRYEAFPPSKVHAPAPVAPKP